MKKRQRENKKRLSANQKGFLRLLVFSVVCIWIFTSVSTVFHPKDGKNYSGYSKNVTTAYRAEEQNTVDVVFIGNSNAYRAFNPTLLWEEFRITSCVVGGPMMRTDEVLRYLEDIFKQQSPKQIVMEVNCLYLYLDTNDFEKKALLVPAFPYTAAVEPKAVSHPAGGYNPSLFRDALDDFEDAIMTKIAYEASLMKHHDRWQSLTSYDFTHPEQQYYYISKGFLYNNKVKPFAYGDIYMGSETDAPKVISRYNRFFFGRIDALCREHGAVLSLVSVPSGTNWNYARHNYLVQLAQEYGLAFTDYNMPGVLPGGIDWSKDTVDGGDHMNTCGSAKVTRAYGSLLTKQFGLKPSTLTEEQAAHWDSDARRYHTEVEKP